MSYQSFLSAILQNKYYTQQEISELSSTIQRNSGSKILSMKLSQAQISLYCPNQQIYACPFSHLFNKINSSPGLKKYELLSSTEKHSIHCQQSRNDNKSSPKLNSLQNIPKSIISINSLDIASQIETCAGSPLLKESIINIAKTNSSITQNIEKKLYTEGKSFLIKDQFSLLKKELQLQSKGFLSKSTEFQAEPNNTVIRRIEFHCKFQISCPYEAYLTIQTRENEKICSQNKKQYALEIVNPNHSTECLLEEEIIKYNENTMKIDKDIEILTRIIQQNSQSLKPKDILRKLSDQLGENEEFIYNGLEKKINKRAIKKYFDNCVAKVRSKIFPQVKSPKAQSPTRHKLVHKMDEDYECK